MSSASSASRCAGARGRRPGHERDAAPAAREDADRASSEHSSLGRVGQLLAAHGFDLDIRRPPLGDPLPETLAGHAGAVIFGGPMSANDPDEFVRRETEWLKVPLSENRPFLGICLGAQMLVNHLGGRVGPREDGGVEIGGIRFRPYPNQAFRYGENAWGIQFHAELTRVMMQRWVVRGAHRFVLPGAQLGREHLQGRMLWDARLRAWLDEFLTLVFGDPHAGVSVNEPAMRIARASI